MGEVRGANGAAGGEVVWLAQALVGGEGGVEEARPLSGLRKTCPNTGLSTPSANISTCCLGDIPRYTIITGNVTSP